MCYWYDPTYFQINAEFERITTTPLQSRVLSQLNVLSSKLWKLIQKQGGQIGKKLPNTIDSMAQVKSNFFSCSYVIEWSMCFNNFFVFFEQDADVDLGQECIIKGLCVYLSEDPDNLIREYVVSININLDFCIC